MTGTISSGSDQLVLNHLGHLLVGKRILVNNAGVSNEDLKTTITAIATATDGTATLTLATEAGSDR